MKLLEKPTPVSKSLLLKFSVDNSQWYLITISARVKDEKQLNSTDDEDLQIEIDGKKFPRVYWGVCWLYHKAQVIEKNGGRTWKSWKEAVSDYNGGGDPNYVEKVYKICWQALSPEGF